MIIEKIEYLKKCDPFGSSTEWQTLLDEIMCGIRSIEWPQGSGGFFFKTASTGRSRGEGNGVKPIKEAFQNYLIHHGWEKETRVDLTTKKRPGPIDITKISNSNKLIAVEWETGNISSSHRSINKLALGLLKEIIVAGVLILPTRKMYRYLTDRVGNYEELVPYFDLWKSIKVHNGVLVVIAIEHDGELDEAPRIFKGTNGRAKI